MLYMFGECDSVQLPGILLEMLEKPTLTRSKDALPLLIASQPLWKCYLGLNMPCHRFVILFYHKYMSCRIQICAAGTSNRFQSYVES